jgi:hypothetical protein
MNLSQGISELFFSPQRTERFCPPLAQFVTTTHTTGVNEVGA